MTNESLTLAEYQRRSQRTDHFPQYDDDGIHGRSSKPDPSLRFDPHKLVEARQAERTSLKERKGLEERLEQEAEAHLLARRRLAETTRTAEELEAELAELRKQVTAAKRAAEFMPVEAHDWSEADTRRYKIDALLVEAGWTDRVEGHDIEYEVQGMPSGSGVGYVDYVLWGADGRPLAVVEAKKALVDPRVGQQQARL